MDDFGVDLDKVLDEFEQQEGNEVANGIQSLRTAGHMPGGPSLKPSAPAPSAPPLYDSLSYPEPPAHNEKEFDISEADFGPAALPLPSLLTPTETDRQLPMDRAPDLNGSTTDGYFMPEMIGEMDGSRHHGFHCDVASKMNPQPSLIEDSSFVDRDELLDHVDERTNGTFAPDSKPELLENTNLSDGRTHPYVSGLDEDQLSISSPSYSITHSQPPDVVPAVITDAVDVSLAPCHETLSNLGVGSAHEQNETMGPTSDTSPVHCSISPVHEPAQSAAVDISPDVAPKLQSENGSIEETRIIPVLEEIETGLPETQPDSTKTEAGALRSHDDSNAQLHAEEESRLSLQRPDQAQILTTDRTFDTDSANYVPACMGVVGFEEVEDGDACDDELESYLASSNTQTKPSIHRNDHQDSSDMQGLVFEAVGVSPDMQGLECQATRVTPGMQDLACEAMSDSPCLPDASDKQLPDKKSSHVQDPRPSLAQELSLASSEQSTAALDIGREEPTAGNEANDGTIVRRCSSESMERFLAPSVTSPKVATPTEDMGYTKVPCLSLGPPTMTEGVEPSHAVEALDSPELSVSDQNIDAASYATAEVREHIEHDSAESGDNGHMDLAPAVVSPREEQIMAVAEAIIQQSSMGLGARPKEPSVQQQAKRSRPNSLLGLSKPDLEAPCPVAEPADAVATGSLDPQDPADVDAQLGESRHSHDLINMQRAQKNKSQLRKKQLNLEIKQQIENTSVVDNRVLDQISVDGGGSMLEPAAPCPVGDRSVVGEDDHPDQSMSMDQPPSSFPGPVSVSAHPPDLSLPSMSSGLEVLVPIATETGASGDHAEGQAEASQAKQKRPTSLSLLPRGDFPGQARKSPVGEAAPPNATVGSDGGLAQASPEGIVTAAQASPAPPNVTVSMAPAYPPETTPADALAAAPSVPSPTSSNASSSIASPERPVSSSMPPTSANINLAITQLGKVAPQWLPDSQASVCMQCDARFTFTKRRHHCRACGKVFCNSCCNLRVKLQYSDSREVRVCSKCYQDLIRAQVYERMHSDSPSPGPNPNNPSTLRRGEPKQVMFSDGIRPGGDLTELDGSAEATLPAPKPSGRKAKKVEKADEKNSSPKTRPVKAAESSKNACLIPENGLPPVILSTGVKGDYSIEENPPHEKVMPQIRNLEDPNPVVFAVNKNLFVLVKMVNLDCCVNRSCWCFTTKGMCTVSQDEIVIVLECLPDEKVVPRDIFCHFNTVYEEAGKGNTVTHLGHTIFAQGFLGSKDHGGFLYIRPSFQCVQRLLLPAPPFIFGILLQKWETPWAKVFPIRLLLRLGAEYRYYPCPLISVRYRKPVYGEIGHTIMNLLADFRNYQYMLPQVRGVVVHMEDKRTYINLPRNRYDDVMKVLNNSNDHVMALGAQFSMEADSHLVCIQNEDGNYQTQAINIQNKPRKITGASFVVFNGALKSSSGLRAKSSIVEDGLMVQITADAMLTLKQALKDMQDFSIPCGSVEVSQPDECVTIQWAKDDKNVNIGLRSPIDNTVMDGIESVHIHNATDYVGENRMLRWTEVFFIRNDDLGNSGHCEPVDLSRLAETLAQAACIALTAHLDKLKEANLTKIGLRATIDPDKVDYEVGAAGTKLPGFCMDDLDNELIPVIHNAASHSRDGPIVLELVFHVIE